MQTRAALSVVAAISAFGLAGCVEAMPEFQANAGTIREAIAKGGAPSPRGATVAISSLEGAPDAVAARFNQVFAKEAAQREIATADAASAHYLVRGYLSAAPADNGTAVTFVYDIFDANDQQRIDRVTDVLTVPATGQDPWAAVDDRVAQSLAGRSADALAAALAETPPARAALAPATVASAYPAR